MARKKYATVGGYTHSGNFEHDGHDKTAKDRALSGAVELLKLLEGQETATKQNVIERIAELGSKGITPRISMVRTIIVAEAQKIGYGIK